MFEESVHYAYMGKKAKPARVRSRLRPIYQRTFIKPWREYREMSQEKLAELVGQYLMDNEISEKGYTHASIGRMENGRIPYSQPIMEGIAKALGVTVAVLISVPPPKKGDPVPPDPETLLRFWKRASGQ